MNRFVASAAVCLLLPVGVAPAASAEPMPPPPPDLGAMMSVAPGVLDTPDGWVVTVAGSDESMQPVAPLTTAVSSREYLVSGTFTVKVTGSGRSTLTGGALDAGIQIGCGIISDETEINPSATLTPGIGIPFTGANSTMGTGLSLQGKVYLKPGQTNTISLNKKTFKGAEARVSFSGVRVKIDQCAGQSFIRSYATATNSTDNSEDIITYLGATKAV
ncbi:MAG: MspA family porin [Mycobacterium sp.]